ncbi:hypothetical protein [Marivirga arenosa]|uniref:Uncharacterized protein n=1 Tax=Marivirga arenosa TaxID=3059076 RepID=A0AA49GDH4_9BACT|nr:hypothetical protein [Marivirga sp. BKB1-2]WKK80183.2 hypothetical protein QYS47_23845 [Marivirga sp. BKB1-2]
MNIKSNINSILMEWDPIGIKEHTDIENEKLRDLIYEIEETRIGFFFTNDQEKEFVVESIFKLNKLKSGL